MAWIEWIAEDEATGRLQEIYRRNSGRYGIDHILKVHSLNPESLEGHARYHEQLMRGPSGLSRAEREMIAVAVSAANQCFY